MRSAISALAFIITGFVAGAVFFISVSLVLAWTGPTSAPPNGNISAPLNVGTTDQIKNAGLGVNSLAVFGNAILAGVSSYLNFGSIAGSTGYGFRDNAGTMEFKNSVGSWQSMLSASSTFSQIKFADGTTQSTAAGGSWIVSGWPDAFTCTDSDFVRPYIIAYRQLSTGRVAYSYTGGPSWYILFNSDGSQHSEATDPSDCDGKTISQLNATGQTFNFRN